MNKLLGTLEVQDHHVEHQLAAVQDHIKNLIGKIQAREDKSETRIENLEGLVKKVRIVSYLYVRAYVCVYFLSISFYCRACNLYGNSFRLPSVIFPPRFISDLTSYLSRVLFTFVVSSQEVAGSLDSRLTALELQMKGTVEKKMLNIESSLDRKMSRLQSQADEFGKESATSWRIPFLILLVLMIAAAVGLYFFYEKMRKMHLL